MSVEKWCNINTAIQTSDVGKRQVEEERKKRRNNEDEKSRAKEFLLRYLLAPLLKSLVDESPLSSNNLRDLKTSMGNSFGKVVWS